MDRHLFLLGQSAALAVRRMERIRTLADVEFRVTSQFGEDGIIEWLCAVLPDMPQSFIEFGVESYAEANTRFLLENRNFKGMIVDADREAMEALRQHNIYWRHDLTAAAAFITMENINTLIEKNGFAGEVGILSMDVDGNDYWFLNAIKAANPVIVITEINAVFGDNHAITIPYRADFTRFSAHHSGLYFGYSIRAAINLMKNRGYTFIGTSSSGFNAFFVRNDYAAAVLARLETVKTWPVNVRESRDANGKLTFARGLARTDLILDMSVVELASQKPVRLRDLQPLFSDEALRNFS